MFAAHRRCGHLRISRPKISRMKPIVGMPLITIPATVSPGRRSFRARPRAKAPAWARASPRCSASPAPRPGWRQTADHAREAELQGHPRDPAGACSRGRTSPDDVTEQPTKEPATNCKSTNGQIFENPYNELHGRATVLLHARWQWCGPESVKKYRARH